MTLFLLHQYFHAALFYLICHGECATNYEKSQGKKPVRYSGTFENRANAAKHMLLIVT